MTILSESQLRAPLARRSHVRLGLGLRVLFASGSLAGLLSGPWLAAAQGDTPEWKPIPVESLVVQEGSALDCSHLVGNAPAGSLGRVIVGRDGHLAFERAPGQRVRFFGFSGHGVPECRTHADVDALVAAIRRQGYSIVRPHFLDMDLMTGAREDFAFDPVRLDLFHYYVARLKENGIHIFVDAMTGWNGYRAVHNPWNIPQDRNLKVLLYHDEDARAHWERGVRLLLTAMNPYTGLTLADDPVVAVLLFFNEQEIRPGTVGLTRPWQEFLERKYRTVAALRSAWGGDALPPSANDFADLAVYSRDDVNGLDANAARTTDIAEFLTGLKTNLLRWYMERVREIGYNGLVTQYDFHKSLYLTPVRAALPVVAMHNYHDHPSGMTQTGSSSLGDAANWWRTTLATRFTGRPFLVTEYGHVYSNGFRYEEGLVVGGYAALQDIDLLMAHQQPVKLWPNPLRTFHVGFDPVLRASQFLTGFLFVRGDVTPAPHRVNVSISPADLADPRVRPLGTMNAEQSRIALVTGLGISSGAFEPLPDTAPAGPDLNLRPAAAAAQLVEQYVATSADRADGSFDLGRFVADLKRRGILPPGNRTDPALGVFESETGELLLEARMNRLTVRTPRLEGAAFGACGSPIHLGHLTIEACSSPGLVAVVAVDGRPLHESRRLVLVLATDARNSGMTFADDGGRTIVNPGELPVLVRTATLRARLASREAVSLRLWALALSGARRTPIPVRDVGGAIEFAVDTASLPDGPATFFELTAD